MKTEHNQNERTEEKTTPGGMISPSAGIDDNPLMRWFISAGAIVFFISVVLWTASLTLEVMSYVLPNNPVVKYFALAIYDIGALVWLGLYTYQAKGTPQRGISLLLFMVDFAGVVLMTAGGVYLGGQTLASVPVWMGGAIVNAVIFSTLANVGGAYYYHLSNPGTREAIQAQELEDHLTAEAMRQARANVQREARQLGAIMARRATARIKYRLALPMSQDERAEWDGETIEGQVIEPQALPAPAGDDVPGWVRGVLRFFGRGRIQHQQPPAFTTSTTSNDLDLSGEE